MTDHEEHRYDVVIIGAGGAGLRAAIAAREAGMRTAIICKSLFGKAHTVMAEGGIAASMGNVNSKDNWQVHFRDTMRGGKFLNHPRMAELHAKEAPDRVWELETYGALFDRTPDGRISQRNFGGHEYPRLAHVGDRTGLELIRTLQQKIVSLRQDEDRRTKAVSENGIGDEDAGLRVFAEVTITELLTDDTGAIAGAFGYRRETGKFVTFHAPAVILATGGIGKSFKVTSNSWEYTGDGHALALRAGSTLVNMEFVQFHPTGMVWPPSVKGILVTESVRGDGGVLRNSEGTRFMFNYVPDVFRAKYAETEEEADGWYKDSEKNRRPPDLLPRDEVAQGDQLRGQGRPRHAARRGLPRRLDPTARRGDQTAAAVDAPPVLRTRRRRHHQGADGGRADLSLRDGRGRGRSRHRRRRQGSRACSPPARWPAGCTAPTGSAATRCPTCWCSAAAPGLGAADYVRGARRFTSRGVAGIDRVGRRAGAGAVPAPRRDGENPYTLHRELQQVMNDLVGIIRKEEEIQQALDAIDALKPRVAAVSVEGHRQFNPGWHLALDLVNMLQVSECVARAALIRQESRGGHTRDDYPEMSAQWRRKLLDLRGRQQRRHDSRHGHRAADHPDPDRPAGAVRAVRAGEVPHRRGTAPHRRRRPA